jgi:tetratricopeptide (TPR) repeat protein
MIPGPRRRAANPAAALLAAWLLAACASQPGPALLRRTPLAAAPSTAPAESPPGPISDAPPPLPVAGPPETTIPAARPAAKQPGETVLKTADPAALARGREEREAIEASIAFGSPSSLARARELAASPKALRPEDAAYLDALARGFEAAIYPINADPDAVKADAAQNSGLLPALREAAAGRYPTIAPEAAGSSMGELVPALSLLASDSSETARKAIDALDRFARLGVPSIVPSIIRGVDAERRSDWQGALGLYRSALAIAPDAWIASLGIGRALAAQRRYLDSIAALGPLARLHAGLPSFDRPYAQALYAVGRYAEAESYIARVLIRDPQDSRFVLMRARLLVASKGFQQARPLLDAYGTVDPSNRLYLLLRALESEGLRAREEAVKWARRGLAAFPDDPELLATASRLLFAGPAFGREEGRSLASRAYELTAPGAAAPQDTDWEAATAISASREAAGVEAARLLAIDAASRFAWTDAASYLKRAGQALGDKALAAKILRKAGDAKGELELATAWRSAEPGSEAATEAFMRALVDSGQDRAAQDAIARTLPGALSPALRSSLYYLQSRLQKSDEAALTLLRAALVENADNPEALAAVSDIQVRRKDYAKARFYLRQAMAISPGDPELEARQGQLDAVSPP